MIYLRNLLFHKKSYRNYDFLHLKMDYVTTTKLTETEILTPAQVRGRLVLQVIVLIPRGAFIRVLCLITEHNLVFKTCTSSELKSIDKRMRACSKESHPDFYNFYIALSRYDKNSGSLCFINRIPFVFGNFTAQRCFMPHAKRERIRGYPDCIDSDVLTKDLQGWKLRNVVGRQNLPVLKFNCKYDIITSKENFAFYQERYPGCRVRDHEFFATFAKNFLAKLTLDLSLATEKN